MKRHILRSICLLAIFCFFTSATLMADERSDAEGKVRVAVTEAFESYVESLNAGDHEAALEFYSDDPGFRWFEDGKLRYSSPDDVRQALQQVAGMGDLTTEFSDTEVVPLSGRTALLTTRFKTTFGEEGKGGFSFSGVMTITIVKEDKHWLMMVGHTSSERER